MDKKVYIVGIGPGSKDYIMPKAVDTMRICDVVVGFKRAMESLDFIDGNKIVVNKIAEVIDIINSDKYESISIAASGDPLFYGITDYLKKNYGGDIEVIPGLSSFQYMMAKLGKSWQGSFLGSLHGREQNFYELVRENRISIWLTDSKHSPSYMCSLLKEKDIEANIYVGQNLSYEDEKIIGGTTDEVEKIEFDGLCVVVVENLTK
ncbi:precorrin-6y C5,15-methyltransferase (decarboxylating) subunit CbiE [Clostridiaceae bacterium UIB06]|uniref:Precorrin-6y C5,15-methyltransferase (Decarboxylating) subunit CbiE n=1 Tax=Clostridium thailandense TaxID=2794346 RepID=A0A949TRJ7_9CLOT|nr:precorrin-6y C5,15-methyltransferase (decarboxylating) subunit CbiE [Clostridium thailandense]MBV7275252.1 precorrin-6y C5,15-methyltransferase (decarboxylating) subunit CbiE [Clostridium thailandense]MCH5137763.1 precorrin-6y C5,15-methyltransferase (decarboxylating) subunit CbiE [Clostridiaceae bacterium UIB06]